MSSGVGVQSRALRSGWGFLARNFNSLIRSIYSVKVLLELQLQKQTERDQDLCPHGASVLAGRQIIGKIEGCLGPLSLRLLISARVMSSGS